MRTSKPVRVLLIVLSALILTATVSILSIGNSFAEENRSVHYDPLNKELEEYRFEYDKINLELERVKNQYSKYNSIGRAMTVLIFQQCSSNLYNEVYGSVLKRYGAVGIFTMTAEQIVGKEGCVTYDQYTELLKKGWTPAIGFPETVPKDFDAAGYFDGIASYLSELSARKYQEYLDGLNEEEPPGDEEKKPLSEEDFALDFPKVFVFGTVNYSQVLYDAVIQRGFNTVCYCESDPHCTLEEIALTDKEGLLLIPYVYTSKRTPIRKNYEIALKEGRNLSLSTRGARTGMKGDTATHDTTVASLKDIVETVKIRGENYRTLKQYRDEKLKADTEYKIIREYLAEECIRLRDETKRLHKMILNVFAEP